VSESKQENSRRHIRFTAPGPASSGYPLGGPVSGEHFGSLASGEAALYPVLEAPLPFLFSTDLDGVSLAHLQTSGFEIDLPEFAAQAQPEPAPAPEPVPPAMAKDTLAVPVRFAAPGVAKLIQGAPDMPMPALPVQLPELQLGIVRRRMVTGANPNKPVAKPEPAAPVAAPKQARPVIVRSSPSQKQAKSAPPASVSPVSKLAIAACDRGSALSVQREDVEPAAAPAPKPKLIPIRKVETRALVSTPAPLSGTTMLIDSDKRSAARKGIIAAGALLVLGLAGYLGLSGNNSAKARSSRPADSIGDATAPSLVMGGGGWTTTWGLDVAANKGKQISIYRPSIAMTDYRLEFRGQIERKALGWVFRAADARNYYVMKLETIKPGPQPVVALVKYAVIEGKETTRTQIMLPFDVALDTIYQVRFDARGDKFTTYVQNKLVDYWTDDRIKTGGTGFYNDTGERGQINSSQVAYLTAGK
jgi:hypothetical protein